MTCWQGNCAGWPDNGQHYAKDMLVDGRTLALLVYERIIDEGHVGGWPNNGQSFSKDMLLAGRTTASAFRGICWWLAKGYVGGWPNNAQSFSKDWRGSSSFSRASREWDAERGIGPLCVEGTGDESGP